MSYRAVRMQIDQWCESIGRDPGEVALVAVSKTVGVEQVGEALSEGCHRFGENRPDELMRKHSAYPQEAWHFIGNIQSRRIPDIVRCSSLIHSLYKPDHVEKVDRAAKDLGKVQDVLLEVNVSQEGSKSGLRMDEVEDMLRACLRFDGIRVRGLMSMAPQGDLAVARACFDALREKQRALEDAYRNGQDAGFMHELSMGMSEDWREGVAAGATIVRIGRAVFDASFHAEDG